MPNYAPKNKIIFGSNFEIFYTDAKMPNSAPVLKVIFKIFLDFYIIF
jgi:hypothetical protein